MVNLFKKDLQRLTQEKILWLATVNTKNVPHLTPIWFVHLKSKIFICTTEKSIKYKNILTNFNISFALEDGINPLCGLGIAKTWHIDNYTDLEVIDAFKKKYDWDISTDKDYKILIEIEIAKLFMRKNM